MSAVISSGKNPLAVNVILAFCLFSGIFVLSGIFILVLMLIFVPLQILRRGALGSKTFEITDETFAEDDGKVVTSISWERIRSISKTRRHIFIRISRLRYFVISSRGFPDEAVFAEYYATLERFRRDYGSLRTGPDPLRNHGRPTARGGDAAHRSIRPLQASDAEAYRAVRLQALHEQPPAFGALPHDEPPASQTAARLEANNERCAFGAFSEGQLVGIVRVSRYASSNEKHRAYLAGLYVLPAHRKSGFGRALANAAVNWASNVPGIRRLNLTVVTAQSPAISLYESLGFRQYGIERETFSDAGKFYDEALMTLPLAP